MSFQRRINNVINNKKFKDYGLIILSVFLMLSVIPIFFISPSNVFKSIYYIKGYGGYGVPIIGLLVGLILLYYGIRGLVKERN